MKSYLLDTHIFLWAYAETERLGKTMTRIMANPNAVKYLSAISLVEIAQLYETKPRDFDFKIPLSTFIYQALTQLQVQILAITPEHAQRYYEIQPIGDHRDPFDRTIIAQAASTGFTTLSDDRKFPLYPITVISNYD